MIYWVFFNISYASSLNILVPLAIHDSDFNGVVYGQDAENDSLTIILTKEKPPGKIPLPKDFSNLELWSLVKIFGI